MAKHRVKGGIYIRGDTYWYRYRGKRGSLGIPAGIEGSKQIALDAFGLKVKSIVEGIGKPTARTLEQLFNRYMSDHGDHLASVDTVRHHRRRLETYFGAGTLLTTITSDSVWEYKATRVQRGGVKPCTVNREITVLRAAYNWGIKRLKWLAINPCADVGIQPGEETERHRPFTDDEELRILAVSPPWLQEIITFLVNTGLRPSETWRLQWPSVDIKQRVLTVESLTGGRHSKNGERRVIPLNTTVLKLLESRVRSLQTRLVFFTEAHSQHDNSNVRRAFLDACRLAQVIDRPRVYDLRHSFASRMVQQGISLYTVQVLLGHKSPSMSQRYGRHNVESLRRGVESLAG